MRKCDRRWWYGVIAFAAMLVAFAPASQASRDVDDLLPLWEVRSGGNTVYLLGSIHLLKENAYPLDPAIYEAFEGANTVVFEIELDELMQGSVEMMTRGMLPRGRTLADVLPADLYAELGRKVAGMPIPFDALKGMKPWMAAMTLTSAALVQAGFDATYGIDMHFHERARAAGKPTRGLETIADQIDVFDGLSETAQIAFLRSTLADLDSAAAQLDRGTDMWRRGEVDEMFAMLTRSMKDQPELVERLITARNRRWVPQIEELLRSGTPALVVVGLGHLVGTGSVVELLQERGYTVSRVRAKAAVGV